MGSGAGGLERSSRGRLRRRKRAGWSRLLHRGRAVAAAVLASGARRDRADAPPQEQPGSLLTSAECEVGAADAVFSLKAGPGRTRGAGRETLAAHALWRHSPAGRGPGAGPSPPPHAPFSNSNTLAPLLPLPPTQFGRGLLPPGSLPEGLLWAGLGPPSVTGGTSVLAQSTFLPVSLFSVCVSRL